MHNLHTIMGYVTFRCRHTCLYTLDRTSFRASACNWYVSGGIGLAINFYFEVMNINVRKLHVRWISEIFEVVCRGWRSGDPLELCWLWACLHVCHFSTLYPVILSGMTDMLYYRMRTFAPMMYRLLFGSYFDTTFGAWICHHRRAIKASDQSRSWHFDSTMHWVDFLLGRIMHVISSCMLSSPCSSWLPIEGCVPLTNTTALRLLQALSSLSIPCIVIL